MTEPACPLILQSASPLMQLVIATARRAAATDAPILVHGPRGAGKTALARAIHHWSRRSSARLLTLDCAALPADTLESVLFGRSGLDGREATAHAGLIAVADGGTLLIEAIDRLAPPTQEKVLRLLQDGTYTRVDEGMIHRVDVRLIAESSVNLHAALRRGRSTEDLIQRLSTIELTLPALSDRREDLPALARGLIQINEHRAGRPPVEIDDAVFWVFHAYDWPGNLTELSDVLDQALAAWAGDRLGIEHLPQRLLRPSGHWPVDPRDWE